VVKLLSCERDARPFGTFDPCDEGDFPLLLFLQMPVMLARGITDVSLYNVSDYATNNMYSGAIHIGMDLIKRSVLTNKKTYDKLFQCAVGKCHRYAVDVDRYVIFSWTVWTRCLLSALFFQSNRHRTYAQRLEPGFRQPQERDTKPPPGEASERFLSTFLKVP
jgi:hypothetical protein